MNSRAPEKPKWYRCVIPGLDDAIGFAQTQMRRGKEECLAYVIRSNFTPAIKKMLTPSNGLDPSAEYVSMRIDPDSDDIKLGELIPNVVIKQEEKPAGIGRYIHISITSDAEVLFESSRYITS